MRRNLEFLLGVNTGINWLVRLNTETQAWLTPRRRPGAVERQVRAASAACAQQHLLLRLLPVSQLQHAVAFCALRNTHASEQPGWQAEGLAGPAPTQVKHYRVNR